MKYGMTNEKRIKETQASFGFPGESIVTNKGTYRSRNRRF